MATNRGAPPPTFGGTGPVVNQPAQNKQAMSAAELQAKYLELQREQEELRRLRQTPLPQAPKPAAQQAREAMMTKRAEALADAAVKKEFSLPVLEQNARNAFKTAQDLLKHPGFEAATGMPNPFKGGFGVFNITGTPAGDYKTALKSAVAEAFIPAFESLKGAGAITEAEGKAALQGLANLDTSMGEKQFKIELQRYVNKIAQGLDTARKQAGMGSSPFSYEDLRRERERRKGRR